MAWEDFARISMQGTGNQSFSPVSAYNSFNLGRQQQRQEETEKYNFEQTQRANEEAMRNKAVAQISRYARNMKNNTPQYRASVYPQVRAATLKLMPELADIMPEQWDEKYVGELDALIQHSEATNTAPNDFMAVNENSTVFDKSRGTFVGGNGGTGTGKKPKTSMVTINTADANGNPISRQVMRMEIPEINGYWVDGYIVSPRHPQGIKVEDYISQNGALPEQYMLELGQSAAGAGQGGSGAAQGGVPATIPAMGTGNGQIGTAGAPARPAGGQPQNPAGRPNAQGYPIGGNEPALKPQPMPSSYVPPTERKRGALPLPKAAPPPQLQIAPETEDPMSGEDQFGARAPIQAAPERRVGLNPYGGRALADEFAPQNALARGEMGGRTQPQNAMLAPNQRGASGGLQYPRAQSPQQPQKTTMGDLWVRAAQGDQSAISAVMNAEEIKSALRGKQVKQATLDRWAETKGNHALVSTTLDEVRDFRMRLQRGEFSMNMLSRGLGAVRSVFNDSPDTYVQGSMMNAALQDMVNARLMANKGVQTDGDATRAREAILSAVDSNDDKTIIAALLRAEKYLQQSQNNFGRAYRQTEQQYPMLKSIQ